MQDILTRITLTAAYATLVLVFAGGSGYVFYWIWTR